MRMSRGSAEPASLGFGSLPSLLEAHTHCMVPQTEFERKCCWLRSVALVRGRTAGLKDPCALLRCLLSCLGLSLGFSSRHSCQPALVVGFELVVVELPDARTAPAAAAVARLRLLRRQLLLVPVRRLVEGHSQQQRGLTGGGAPAPEPTQRERQLLSVLDVSTSCRAPSLRVTGGRASVECTCRCVGLAEGSRLLSGTAFPGPSSPDQRHAI